MGKKKQKKTITNRKNTTTNNVVNNNDEIIASSPSTSMALSAPSESDESPESKVMSAFSEKQLPSTTTVDETVSTLLVHEKNATTTRTAADASASASASLLSS